MTTFGFARLSRHVVETQTETITSPNEWQHPAGVFRILEGAFYAMNKWLVSGLSLANVMV